MNHRKAITNRKPLDPKVAETSYRTVRPRVDIFEDDTGITVLADMPGVSQEGLDIQVDRETLSIDGCMGAIAADIRTTHYQRSFSLSSELDSDRIEAMLKDGVVSLRIPKREQYQPRKIEIRSG
ncbi:MAG: Hsp20/alpha crystallin family protein [Candidatus Thiodiazotropha sp. (ex Dulcina madagascariensis)]|nr:Hsp20/alpha crystallin family protein [Candidatus Thiodiazotropha sp. (ex Dulcina madagascariensis)]